MPFVYLTDKKLFYAWENNLSTANSRGWEYYGVD